MKGPRVGILVGGNTNGEHKVGRNYLLSYSPHFNHATEIAPLVSTGAVIWRGVRLGDC